MQANTATVFPPQLRLITTSSAASVSKQISCNPFPKTHVPPPVQSLYSFWLKLNTLPLISTRITLHDQARVLFWSILTFSSLELAELGETWCCIIGYC